MKFVVYRNFAVTACALGLLGLMTGCLEMSVSFESTKPDSSVTTTEETSNQPTTTIPGGGERAIALSASNVTTASSPETTSQNSAPTPAVVAYRVESQQSKVPGLLRMSNQTNQPVRLALLARQSGTKKAKKNPKFDIPAHWDFAPQEGSSQGLVLSLPQGNLKLEKGDILVAFAQDGSRRYWGPYVVGETSAPSWNAQTKEWQLVLTP
jgi:hypothetical protein